MKLLLVLSLALLAACGRSNTVYQDAGDGVVGTDGRSTLPAKFYDQSVNNAVVDVASSAARFRLLGGTSAGGSFVDPTLTGNRALLGIGAFDASLLSNFSMAVTSSGSSALRVSLLVDLKCDASSVRTISAAALSTGSATLSTDDAVWTAPAGDISDSSGSVVVASSTASSLSALIAAYPAACLRNDRSDDPEAPSAIPVGAVMLSIGGGTSTSVEELDIQSLTLNGVVYNTWGVR